MVNKNIQKNLINKAKRLVDKHYSTKHQVAAILRAKNGRLFEGISVQGQRLHLCAEWSALEQALLARADIEMSVAVYRNKRGNYKIFSPCGICRELYITYFPHMKIVLDETKSVEANTLLPYMWKRKK